jgi:hypothetical protein
MRHIQAEEWSGTSSEVHRLAWQGVDLQNTCTAFPAVPRLPSSLCKQALAEGRFNEQQLAEMAPYLVAVSPQASKIEVRGACCGIQQMHSADVGTQCKFEIW